LVRHDYDILLGTGHPQGGNAMGTSPNDSVIGPDFKVFGYNNLYLCDASVFPTSTTVNPQLTVMALAHYAAQRID
jgi:choline dehydrogenase-like flavoprotein